MPVPGRTLPVATYIARSVWAKHIPTVLGEIQAALARLEARSGSGQ